MSQDPRVTFAAARRGRQDRAIDELLPLVRDVLKGRTSSRGWWRPLRARVRLLFNEILTEESDGEVRRDIRSWARLSRWIESTITKTTKDPSEVTERNLAVWLANAAINAATTAAALRSPEALLLEWVTMHDSKVREPHRHTDGQQRPPGETYDVDGYSMAYPGDPRAPIELWINCRCVLRPVPIGQNAINPRSGGAVDTLTVVEDEVATENPALTLTPQAWHGVLAPEGVWSGDGRQFAPGSLRHRDLPLPLTWQKASEAGHDGSVVVGRIENITRDEGLIRADGTFLATPEADEVVGLISEFGRFGVSVDADDSTYEFDEESGRTVFTSARIASSSIVPIPAFAQAWVALGGWDDDVAEHDEDLAASAEVEAMRVSDTPWSRFDASDYTDEQWYRACVLHRNGNSRTKSDNGLPIREPSGALNRNGIHAAASRFNQVDAPDAAKAAAARALRGAYRQIGEDAPDAISAVSQETEEFRRGPGWVTHPKETRRLHRYWTEPGQPGYQKINWGVPGDFNRCRALVGEKIAANSPADLRYINQICAQWHHDATGFWPGRAPTEAALEGQAAPALTLVASASKRSPASWFADPRLDALTPLTITDEGQVWGHLCGWETCHVGFQNDCVAPPHNSSGYSQFLIGQVLTDDGSSVNVGHITLGGGHAGAGLQPRAAMAHYDSTSTVVCDVACGEDEHGIWLAGHIRSGADEATVAALRASALSGDWRMVRGQMELIAALAVNVPGFAVPRVRVGHHGDEQVSLVAAGAMQTQRRGEEWLDMDAVVEAVEQALSQRSARRERMSTLRQRVGVN